MSSTASSTSGRTAGRSAPPTRSSTPKRSRGCTEQRSTCCACAAASWSSALPMRSTSTMFTELLGEHFVHTALIAGAIVAVVAGTIGVFVVMRGLSFAVHAISELGFTGATGALVLGLDPVLGMICGSVAVGAVLGVLSLRGRERDSAIGAVLAFGLGLGVLFLSLYQGYATTATNL